MKQRWLVVAIGLPLLLLVLLACPAWATMLLVCAIAGIAAYELLHTAGKNVPTSIYLLTVTAAAAYEVLLYYSEWTFFGAIQTVTVLRWAFLMLLFFTAVHRFGGERPFAFSTLCAAVVGGIVDRVLQQRAEFVVERTDDRRGVPRIRRRFLFPGSFGGRTHRRFGPGGSFRVRLFLRRGRLLRRRLPEDFDVDEFVAGLDERLRRLLLAEPQHLPARFAARRV